MRTRRVSLTIVAVAALSAVMASQTPSGHALFQQALAKERVEGNLPEAIKLYERVVSEFASDRALVARALVQIGLSYEKLGRDDAVRVYERLVRDFADQEDAVVQARARLALLKPAPGPAAGAIPVVRAFSKNAVLSISPDGAKAAFLSFDTGQNLSLYDVASQQTTRLTDFDGTAGSSKAFDAAWSPDGGRIAFGQCRNRGRGSESPCELRVTTLSGESRVISRNQIQRPGGWLPDGSAIVVTLQRRDRTASIGLAPADGGPFIPLRSITKWTGMYAPLPSVSPDGRWFAFVEDSPGDIHVIGRDGRIAHRITEHPADDQAPVWSPDGRHLAFLSDRGGAWALWTVAVRDGQPTGDPVRIKDGMQGASLAGWTKRGLVYSQSQPGDDIYTVSADPATGTPSGSARLISYRHTGGNVTPSWSPDGRYLAFTSLSLGAFPFEPTPRAVVLLPSAGGEPRAFPFPNPTHIGQLRWFGDSRGLGFQGFDARGEPTLFRLTLATGEWKTFPLPAPPFTTRIEWNADGSRYFYGPTDRDGNLPRIIEHDLQSDRERIVYRGTPGGSSRDLRFSPDRRLLAIAWTKSAGSADHEIVVLNVETGQTRRVYDTAAGESVPFASVMWSPDGRALLVRIRIEGQADGLRWIPIDGGEVRGIPLGAEITRLVSPGRDAQSPIMRDIVWSPDGSRLAFVLRTLRIESFVMENPLAGTANASARK